MLSAEPELALRMASNMQSILMVLGGELTPAARDVWTQYAQNSHAHKFVVLDTGAGADAAAAETVTQMLEISPSNVFLLGIKKAVAARLSQQRDSPAIPSGFEQLEEVHAEKLVPDRQALLLSAVANEI